MYQIHMLRYYSETCCNSKHTYNSKDTPRVKNFNQGANI